MPVPAPFPEANVLLRPPSEEDAAAGTVGDLHVHAYRDLDGQSHVVSLWQLTPEDLVNLKASNGALWLHAWGSTHPPLSIQTEPPYFRQR